MSSAQTTYGAEIEAQIAQAIRDLATVPLPGGRDLPVLTGLLQIGRYTEPQDNVLLKAIDLLIKSERVFAYGNTVVIDTPCSRGDGRELRPLRTGSSIVTGAEDVLANLFVCQEPTSKDGDREFPVPKWFVDGLLRSELLERLPRILHYATRPVFDSDFVLRGPGWHHEAGILVHGPEIDPVPFEAGVLSVSAIERLPRHLRVLLQDFCFKSDADVANTLGVFVTGLLMNHFIDTGKAVVLVDGNQPDLGKTLLLRVLGWVLDGDEPYLVPYTSDDEELAKRICSKLRGGVRSVLIIDNCKTRSGGVISSPTIEANSMAPEMSFRILGKSEDYSRPNDIIFGLTMNETRASKDLISRSTIAQIEHEGRTEDRAFACDDLVKYAREHRLEILGELAGIVEYWNQRGGPLGQQLHRLRRWSASVGGILGAAGFPEFLTNTEAATSFNNQLDELAGLAEAVVATNGPYSSVLRFEEQGGGNSRKSSPGEFERFFRAARICVDELDAKKSTRARQVMIGRFLSPNVGRAIEFAAGERTGRAMLRKEDGRSGSRKYYFEVIWSLPTCPASSEAPPAVVPVEGVGASSASHSATPSTPASTVAPPDVGSLGPEPQAPPRAAMRPATAAAAAIQIQPRTVAEGNSEEW